MMKTIINAGVGILLRTGVKDRMIDCVCLFIIFSMCYSFTFPCCFIRDALTAVRVAQRVHVCMNGLLRTIISISPIVVVLLLCTLYCYYLGKFAWLG